MSEILKKYRDCRSDLIGGSGNIDVCSGRQIPSRRHWRVRSMPHGIVRYWTTSRSPDTCGSTECTQTSGAT